MKKTDIQRIRLDILSDKKSALSILMDKDGMLKRQGNGSLPIDETEIIGHVDAEYFANIVELVDEDVMPFANLYDHPNKAGTPLTVSAAFMDTHDGVKRFEFRLGTETTDIGDLFPFFDRFISQVVHMTQAWYDQEKARQESSDSTPCKP
ncbi:MAG: Unknown protein [uncultured Thiotrichaceae bacterium]|uniref:Uncharacterized protein n=1 Tax=uncultured Thiotrichaceae bacterium TaxID=298394 RepID=A0A6S6TI04_9GAMM|nr:MAG: Unknown protein [uncultured Thiotrichaceae bacterium]